MSVHIVGIGGTLQGDPSSLDHACAAGAITSLFTGDALRAPLYEPQPTGLEPMIAALRQADGVILASPGYLGSSSATLKNAPDNTEQMAGDAKDRLDE